MSTVTGTILSTTTGARAGRIPVVFVYRSSPAVTGSGAVNSPDRITLTNDIGYFSVVLPMGTYDMVVAGKDIYRIVVPDDDDSYDFADILDPESEVTQSVANPVAVLGLVISENESTLATARTANSALRAAILYAPADAANIFYRWDNSSSATHNGTSIINPTGNSGNGRWLLVDISAAASGAASTSQIRTVNTKAAMLALPGSAALGAVLIRAATREPGAAALYSYTFGDTSTTEVTDLIERGDDGLGTFFAEL